MDDVLLHARGISKSFGGAAALSGVDLTIRPGEVHALLGANGAGKSTLIKAITGIYRADEGMLRWNGEEVTVRSLAGSIELGIATMFQQLNVPEDLTVAEYLTLGREQTRLGFLNKSGSRRAAQQSLADLGVTLDLDRDCRTLSVAERELVEIARAISLDARLVIMDEPTASLGAAEVRQLFAVIENLRARGVAVLYVSHKLEEVLAITDRSTILRDGRNAGELDTDGASEDDLLELMVGDYARSEGVSTARAVSDSAALQLRGVSTTSGLQSIDLALHSGEILGVYGLMGAGRTELLRAIYGLDRITEGELILEGKSTSIASAVEATRLGIGLVPEDRVREAMILDATVAANVTLSAPRSTGRYGFFARSREQKVAKDVVSSIRIKVPSVEAPITALSGGNQQKVVIGRWLVAKSRILLLDDPTVGVDVAAKHEIYRLIKELTEQGVSVIVCSSELPEILHLADRIAIMHRKRIVNTILRDDADPEDLIRQSIVGRSGSSIPENQQ